MAKLLIHAGMNKTGSSSIQFALNGHARDFPDALGYVSWPTPNHSEMFNLLFKDWAEQQRYHIFRTQGRSQADLEDEAARWLPVLEAELRDARAPVVVISGEDLTQPTPTADGLRRLRDFAAPLVDSIEVLAYVRPPLSFVNSSFQQRVKSGGLGEIDLDALWPRYRARFEQLDSVFGADSVTLIPFDRKYLVGGDVVADAFRRLGFEAPKSGARRVNDALSTEALALLFVQRCLGPGLRRGHRGATRHNNALIHLLSRIEGSRFSFAPDLLEALLKRHAEDLSWIETRMGISLPCTPELVPDPIRSKEDFLRIARSAVRPLLNQVSRCATKPTTDPTAAVLALMECLFDLVEPPLQG